MAGQQQTDPILTVAVIVVMIMAGIYGAWLINYKMMGPALIYLKMYELYPLTFFSDNAAYTYSRLQDLLKLIHSQTSMGYGHDHTTMWSFVGIAGQYSGAFYSKAVGLLALILAGYTMFAFPSNQFKTRFNLESMMRVQAKTWPIITPFLKFDPCKLKSRPPGTKVPKDLPLFAEALYPEEWMAHNRIRVVNGVPDRDQMRRALMVQLGARFEGLDKLPEHIYCIAAALALKGARKRDDCDKLFGEIAKCWTPETGFVPSATVKSIAAKTLSERKFVEPLLAVMNNHAYVATAMIAVLSWARLQGGVLAPAQFVWLRGEDRALWYPLNNLGRRSFHAEAAGAMAHYQAEVGARKPIVIPRLDAAVVAIAQYISETRAAIPEVEGGDARPERIDGPRPDSLMLNKPAARK